jgi:hypothetical protein
LGASLEGIQDGFFDDFATSNAGNACNMAICAEDIDDQSDVPLCEGDIYEPNDIPPSLRVDDDGSVSVDSIKSDEPCLPSVLLKKGVHDELKSLKHIMDCLYDGDHNINIPSIMASFPTSIISHKHRPSVRPTPSGFIDLSPTVSSSPSSMSLDSLTDYDAMEIDPVVISEPKEVQGILKRSKSFIQDSEGTKMDLKQEGKGVSFSANTEVFEYNPSKATNQGRKWSYGMVDFNKRTPRKKQSRRQRVKEMKYLRKVERALRRMKKRERSSRNRNKCMLTPTDQELLIVKQAIAALRDEENEPTAMDF